MKLVSVNIIEKNSWIRQLILFYLQQQPELKISD